MCASSSWHGAVTSIRKRWDLFGDKEKRELFQTSPGTWSFPNFEQLWYKLLSIRTLWTGCWFCIWKLLPHSGLLYSLAQKSLWKFYVLYGMFEFCFSIPFHCITFFINYKQDLCIMCQLDGSTMFVHTRTLVGLVNSCYQCHGLQNWTFEVIQFYFSR